MASLRLQQGYRVQLFFFLDEMLHFIANSVGHTLIRKDAFEVTSMDGGASVVLYSENPAELSSWYGAIKERIDQLLDQSVRKTAYTIKWIVLQIVNMKQ